MKEKIEKSSLDWVNRSSLTEDYKNRDITKYKEGNVVLIGMRRLGKTEYLKYRFNLFKETQPNNKINEDDGVTSAEIPKESTYKTLFVDFDDPVFSTIEFNDRTSASFEKFNNSLIEILDSGEYELVLFDEIQNKEEWSRWLKGLSDKYDKITFIATGSDSEALSNGSETGLGRFKILFIGNLTYKEFNDMNLTIDKSFENYSNYPFPGEGMNDTSQQYQLVFEKQVDKKSFKKTNIASIIKSIYLNPGINHNVSRMVNKLNEEYKTKISSAQYNSMIEFLKDSRLVISLDNKYATERSTKISIPKHYSSNWNLYRIENDKTLSQLTNNTIPKRGFIFENIVISSIYSSLHDLHEVSKLKYYNDGKIDFDFVYDDNYFEIKSYDFISKNIRWEDLIKKQEMLTAVIHTGETKEYNKIQFYNVEEFLKEELWKQEKN